MVRTLKELLQPFRDLWTEQIELLKTYKGVPENFDELVINEGKTWKEILEENSNLKSFPETVSTIFSKICEVATLNNEDDAPENFDEIIAYLANNTDENIEIKYSEAFLNVLESYEEELVNKDLIITATEDYLKLEGRKLENIIDNTHYDYINTVNTSLRDLVYWYLENDKLFDTRAEGIDIFDYDINDRAEAINIDKVENYAKALERLGLDNFEQTTITNKLGTNTLNDIPTGKTLTQLISDSNTHATCGGGACPDPSHHTNYTALQSKSQEYQRIHTKLSGKVSDSELQVLLDSISTCSHSDYDALKSEKDTLQSENTQLKEHKCDYNSKVVEKEKEIIDKIITDLGLSTERERENILEAVIAEIKSKITPPQDNSQLKDLQTQLKNKETEISELKKGNQSQLDLEKLISQKQAENKELTTAKNNLESQLNQKQKELLNQVLHKSGEVKEKTIKEEIIKIIETSLTSQGISSQLFSKEITPLSSLTDIQKLSGKYSNQKIDELRSSQKSAYSLNVVLGVLSLASLIALAYLLIKVIKKDSERSSEEEKGL